MREPMSSQQVADLKRREWLSAKSFDETLRFNQKTIEDQAAKIEQLEAALATAKGDAARVPGLETRIQRITTDRDFWRSGCLDVSQKHQKLSGIVRLAMEPAEYHTWRVRWENDSDS